MNPAVPALPPLRALALRLAKVAMDDFDAQVANPGPLPTENGAVYELERGRSPAEGLGHTFLCPSLPNGANGLQSQPADLAAFVRSHSNRAVAAMLGVGLGTANRLKQGYWPADSRKIVQAWTAYKGRTAQRATSWFVRRVSVDGVRHGGKWYTASQLAGREGELLAVARVADGELLAQTLELPAERIVLTAKG